MKNHYTNRGSVPTDTKEFSQDSYVILLQAQKDIFYLLERGYPIKSASTFVGNHYLLSERQRLALVRATSTYKIINERKNKENTDIIQSQKVYIDGLNLIITLEVALSGSILISCMDGTIRDLAGLRGTYRLIDKTDIAIRLIGEKLEKLHIDTACFYLDSPVSNTGRLKQRIAELLEPYHFEVEINLVNNADINLENKSNIITSDSIVLNKCISWINLAAEIIRESIPNPFLIDLSKIDDENTSYTVVNT
ncbi:DUF434 domain-containing protein [Anaerocolumna sedimenticola]|uniref:DUF434 domain-containing protein n=1 Tax=Anaerocolumna sedimenticola TaxID=2696063 RepID=A0A6P1TM48_9FIRM|nr:DUF434 domain-containing protein [Anaerocolumna sedimenticola]QHQ62104.1 DUF434 domain-containing protein [Anaerocolumna sedimenticola]